MAKRLSCLVGVLLACGGAVDSKVGSTGDRASDAAQVVPSGESIGAAAGDSAGPMQPAELPVASPELPVASPELTGPELVSVRGETIADAQTWPTALALDGTHVYWANWGGYREGSVQRVSKQGGSPEVLARSSNRPDSLALDGSYAYFAERVLGALSRVPIAGGEPAQVVGDVRDLAWALADQVVYFQTDSSRGIQTIAKQGGDTQSLVPTANATRPLHLRAGYIYWSEQSFGDPSMFDYRGHQIWRAAVEGGEPELLFTEPEGNITGMALDDHAIYYGWIGVLPECGCEGSALRAAAHGAAAPATFARVQTAQIETVATDATHIYWATMGEIYRTSKDGTSTVNLASDLPWVSALAVDAEHLYFATYE